MGLDALHRVHFHSVNTLDCHLVPIYKAQIQRTSVRLGHTQMNFTDQDYNILKAVADPEICPV